MSTLPSQQLSTHQSRALELLKRQSALLETLQVLIEAARRVHDWETHRDHIRGLANSRALTGTATGAGLSALIALLCGAPVVIPWLLAGGAVGYLAGRQAIYENIAGASSREEFTRALAASRGSLAAAVNSLGAELEALLSSPQSPEHERVAAEHVQALKVNQTSLLGGLQRYEQAIAELGPIPAAPKLLEL